MNKPAMIAIARNTAALVVLVVLFTACGSGFPFHRNVHRPAESEFGLGPRTSAGGHYVATLEPAQPLKVRKLQTVRVAITDANGQPLDNLTIAIDGGMPQHGHGLPTRPRISQNLGNGRYDIEGVRFSMGGWWEFKLAVNGPAGPETVTFNLAL